MIAGDQFYPTPSSPFVIGFFDSQQGAVTTRDAQIGQATAHSSNESDFDGFFPAASSPYERHGAGGDGDNQYVFHGSCRQMGLLLALRSRNDSSNCSTWGRNS